MSIVEFITSLVEKRCQFCKEKFLAKKADVKRGWGRFCSKSCKAKHQQKKRGGYVGIMAPDHGQD